MIASNNLEANNYKEFMLQYADDMTDGDDGELNLDPFYKYGPLSNLYWEYNPRIVVCNLEAYGEAEGIIDFNIDLYANEWMRQSKGYNANTVLYTSKFVSGLLKSINSRETGNIDFRSFSKIDLIESMRKVAYLNFRVDQNTNQSKKAEESIIREQFKVTKPYFKNQIAKLNPKIIIVSSALGCELFNSCFEGCNLYFQTVKEWDNKVICSINHFSRVKYSDFDGKIKEIISVLERQADK